MPRYYCDYCGTYLTHDSAPGRRQHNRGKRPPPHLREALTCLWVYYASSKDSFERRGMNYGMLLLWNP